MRYWQGVTLGSMKAVIGIRECRAGSFISHACAACSISYAITQARSFGIFLQEYGNAFGCGLSLAIRYLAQAEIHLRGVIILIQSVLVHGKGFMGGVSYHYTIKF